MAQQTATDWLIEQLGKTDPRDLGKILTIHQQAKEMEKQQREDDYKRGWEEATSIGVKESYKYQDRRSIN